MAEPFEAWVDLFLREHPRYLRDVVAGVAQDAGLVPQLFRRPTALRAYVDWCMARGVGVPRDHLEQRRLAEIWMDIETHQGQGQFPPTLDPWPAAVLLWRTGLSQESEGHEEESDGRAV